MMTKCDYFLVQLIGPIVDTHRFLYIGRHLALSISITNWTEIGVGVNIPT